MSIYHAYSANIKGISILKKCLLLRQAEFFSVKGVVNLITKIWLAKVGICNLGPHLRNSAILGTTKLIAELRTKKSCGIAIADLQNLTFAIPQLTAVSSQIHYFLVPFPQLRMVLKSNQKYFLNCFFSMETQNLPWRDSNMRFWPQIFF
jgi:hypothetical protein